MPLPTPFHRRAAALSETAEWRDWAGYLAAVAYLPSHEREYYAFRSAAGLIDVSPLFKYEVRGPDAAALLDRVITRSARRCEVGQVLYTPWCDDHGKVIDDGTVARLAPDRFRLTAADPNLRWLQDCGYGFDAEVRDVTTELAALALQGPRSRAILEELGLDVAGLGRFRLIETRLRDFPLTITRTGYTGDLGYELWVSPIDAEELWDLLMAAGSGHGLLPAGLAALDMARVEAGLLLIEVDYISARSAIIEAQKSSPYEIGLGWTVKLDKPDFIGRKALLAERSEAGDRPGRGRRRFGLNHGDEPLRTRLVGLEVSWRAIQRVFATADLPPLVAGRTVRARIPVYHRRRQVGQATSLLFSPVLKRYVALASVELGCEAVGGLLDVEMTVEGVRHTVPAKVVKTPFFAPARRRD